MLLPSLRHTVSIAKPFIQNLLVGITEMEQVQIFGYMKVMSLNTMEATAPLARLGNNGRLSVSSAYLRIMPLNKEWLQQGKVTLLTQLLATVKS